MDRKEFLKTIGVYRRKLNMGRFLETLMIAMLIGSGIGILFQGSAFVIPFYHAKLWSVGAVIAAILTALIFFMFNRASAKDAALVMDRYGFKERIITAYENLEAKGTMVELQRRDAMELLRKNKEKIKISIWPSLKKTIGVLTMLILMLVLMYIPSSVKERAKELHELAEAVEEKQEEVEELMDELEELVQEELSEEQLADLQEMLESLAASMQEFGQAGSMQEVATATEKLEYKYENMSSQLGDMAQMLESGANISPMTAEAMQELAQQMQELSGNQSLASGQTGQEGNGQEGQNGQNGQNTGQGQNGEGQGGDQGQGNGEGQGGGEGQGNGEGQGQEGQGGQGEGSGNGRGEGSSSTPHDYVSIPNAIADSGNLTGNVQDHENSDYFKTQNGISWEGTHVDYEEVIGKYEQNAYEGISNGQYPSGMEEIIKDYFSSFN